MASRTKTGGPLQRGLACLCCRKKKLKCDGTRPVCRQCIKMNRHDECVYDNKRHESRTQKLREKLSMLEERLRELESDHTGSDSTGSPSASDSFPSYTRSPTVQFITSAIEPEQPFSMSRVGSPSVAHLESFALSNTLSATFEGSDIPTWPIDPSVRSSPQSSLNMPFYGEQEPNTSCLFPENEHGVSPFFDSYLGQSPSVLPPRTSNSVYDSISPENQQLLFNIFLSHRHQFGFDSNTDRFQLSPQTPSHQQPHPALMNAIYLLASYFSQLKWASDLEQKLLAQAVHDITVALDQSDRLVDIVQASSLLAVYLYANNRILEGYSRAYSAAKLAVNLGLHQITSDFHAHQTYKSGPLGQMSATVLPPPRDLLELRDRISVFWQAFMVDRCWSVANGLPVALPHGNRIQFRINTPWPRPDTEQIFHREGADVDHDTVRGLLDQNPSVPATPCLPAFRAKAAALYEYTSRLASGPKDDAYWAEHRSMTAAVQQFAATIPVFTRSETWHSRSPSVDVSLFAVHTMVHVARLHLQHDARETLRGVTSVVALIRQLNDGDYKHLDPILSSCWYCVAKIYIRILAMASRNSHGGITAGPINAIERDLDVLTDALQTLSTFFLLAGDYMKRVKQARAEVHITPPSS